MERKQKNLISVLLLTVGVIFILVAGSIFVTTAWKYLPVFVKQLALLVVAAGMFGGSFLTSKNEKLGWISDTLFHVGNAFVGFFMIAIMGGVVENYTEGNAFKVLVAAGAMMVPVIMKLIIKKKAFDFATLSILVDIGFISGCVALEGSVKTYIYLLAGFVLALTAVDYIQQKSGASDRGFQLCVCIVHLIHAIYYSLLTIGYSLCDETDLDSILFASVIVVVTGIAWLTRETVELRVCNSLASFWLVIVAVLDVFNWLEYAGSYRVAWFIITIVVSGMMVFFAREEMTGLLVATAVIIPYGQLFFYWADAFTGLFSGMDSAWSTTYYPYSIVLGIAFAVLYMMHYSEVENTWKESRLLKLAGLQLATGFWMWIASKMPEAWVMVFFLLIAMNIFMIGIAFPDTGVKRVFRTIALPAFITAVLAQPFVEIPDAYTVEWVCFLIAMGIVLFRFIWYDKKETFSILYFITICVLLGVLLLSDLISGGIGNVLILGLTGIVMLILASIQNNKKYVVASSVTLILLVLYLTREFWLSIAWWVYLFAAGVVLVLLAVKKAKEA